MSGIGFSELVLLFIIGLLILGPERLPRVATQIGRWVGRARRTANQLRYQLEREIALADINKPENKKPEDKKPKSQEEKPGEKAAGQSDTGSDTGSAGGDTDAGTDGTEAAGGGDRTIHSPESGEAGAGGDENGTAAASDTEDRKS